MSAGPLLDELKARIARDQGEGDIAYFHALLLQLEYITKLVTAGLVACLEEEPERVQSQLIGNTLFSPDG